MVKMSDLKECMEKRGFENVVTYINSGNVIFDTGEKSGKINRTNRKLVVKKIRI